MAVFTSQATTQYFKWHAHRSPALPGGNFRVNGKDQCSDLRRVAATHEGLNEKGWITYGHEDDKNAVYYIPYLLIVLVIMASSLEQSGRGATERRERERFS